MAEDTYNIHDALQAWFVNAGKIVIAGIGNPVRRDDFVGLKIVQDLQGKVSRKVCLLECETVPERFMQEIVDYEPSHVLLVDAAFLGLKSGLSRLVFPEQVSNFSAITTHILPLRIFCEYVAKMSGAMIGLLLVEPENVEFGEGLSPKLETAAKEIVKVLLEMLP